jgi:hypothetical protein
LVDVLNVQQFELELYQEANEGYKFLGIVQIYQGILLINGSVYLTLVALKRNFLLALGVYRSVIALATALDL